ncbi:hypothetical protein KCTC52924_00800 [Arenibacter antarcticus]|uniref:PmoA family protein n=1 Tax=Arenibacter antarcticus TaxID=2040469 RepID=A0ABW5VAJ1_9FLAO|nr:PmoA family protein [Arenibacter sp. H213]MCM4167686.1 hypothetical protein [Arenibacter sp. H213]
MKCIFYCYVLILSSACSEQGSYKFQIAGSEGASVVTPIALNVEALGNGDLDWEEDLVLSYEDRKVPFQIDINKKKLWFIHSSNNNSSYEIVKEEGKDYSSEGVKIDKNNGNLHLSKASIPLLTYRYGMTYPPEGVDSIFRKSGYIHPLLSPSGDTLSRIQPPDHYHHYGIWGPWTHTQIEGERVDFWNLAERQGTVLFKDFNDTYSGPVYGGFNAHQEHINLKASEDKRIALNEDLEVKVWDLGRSDRYMVDYTSTFSTPLNSGILFEAYRYGGGLGMRFTERWHRDNCTVLTSEGNDRLTADGTNARWCMVTGEAADGKGTNGILFLSYPENRSHPEPMRVWPIDGNGGRGDMFFEFCPIRHEEWQIEPNKEYELKYRMVVFDGKLTADEAESYWKSFAVMPKIIKE